MKFSFLWIVILLISGKAFSQTIKNIQVYENKSDGLTTIEYIISGNKVKITGKEFYRSFSFSKNESYLMVLCGSDPIGTISFYRAENGQRIVEDFYIGYEPKWQNSKLQYEAVLYFGQGFTVREDRTFDQGKVISGKQIIGAYHGDGEKKVDPLCNKYKFDGNGSYKEIFDAYIRDVNSWSKTKVEISEYKKLPPFTGSNISNADMANIVGISKKVIIKHRDKKDRFLCVFAFNNAYLLMEISFRQKQINKKEMNEFTKELLFSMGISDVITPWLFK
jgi:hypothetical protein